MYYNSGLLQARKGDILLFSDRMEREIEYLSPIKAKSGLTDYFCRKTYGIGMKLLKERWKVNLEFEGYNIKAINEDRVMLIFLKELEEEKNERGKKR